jgi:hypothetical protein
MPLRLRGRFDTDPGLRSAGCRGAAAASHIVADLSGLLKAHSAPDVFAAWPEVCRGSAPLARHSPHGRSGWRPLGAEAPGGGEGDSRKHGDFSVLGHRRSSAAGGICSPHRPGGAAARPRDAPGRDRLVSTGDPWLTWSPVAAVRGEDGGQRCTRPELRVHLERTAHRTQPRSPTSPWAALTRVGSKPRPPTSRGRHRRPVTRALPPVIARSNEGV